MRGDKRVKDSSIAHEPLTDLETARIQLTASSGTLGGTVSEPKLHRHFLLFPAQPFLEEPVPQHADAGAKALVPPHTLMQSVCFIWMRERCHACCDLLVSNCSAEMPAEFGTLERQH